mmetsp:Transcript_3634/g.9930  ORF Transcript_3634/g.9930 Transcript_3634/m.9930 type:complete len:275 (-) Transcript_3634:753-1577(-)
MESKKSDPSPSSPFWGAGSPSRAMPSTASAAASAAGFSAAGFSAALNPRDWRRVRRASSSNSTCRNFHVSSSSSDALCCAFTLQNPWMAALSPATAASKSSIAGSSCSSRTCCTRTAVGPSVPSGCFDAPKETSRPPKANVAPHGRFSHAGAFLRGVAGPTALYDTLKSGFTTFSFSPTVQSVRLYRPTRPSNEAAENSPGVVGLHCTSKFQLPLEGSSQSGSPESVSQQMVRLSFPEDSIREESAWHQARDSTPLVCPENSRSGEMEFLRSHT